MKPPPIPWWRTDLGIEEIRGVERSIRNRCINQGPVCEEFEHQLAEILDVPHVVTCSNGSAALVMAMKAFGVGPGDEVIVPAITFVATANAALLLGAKVKLVDVRRDRPLIDPLEIERAISPKTKVIVAVHLNGAACDIETINAMAAWHGVKVIEDAAQAFGSRNARGCLGTQTDAGVFSMSIAKLITTGEGGFVAVRDEAVYSRLLKLRNQGVLVVANNVFDEFGFNFRLNDMLAGIGIAQARKFPQKTAAVNRVYRFYKEKLAGLDYLRMLDIRTDQGELPLWSQALCSEREKVIALLAARGVQANPVNPCLGDSNHLGSAGVFPIARVYAAAGLRLPSGPDQPQADLERTVEALNDIASEIRTPVEALLKETDYA